MTQHVATKPHPDKSAAIDALLDDLADRIAARIARAPAAAASDYYSATSNPVAPNNTRAWRAWLLRVGIPFVKAGRRTLAKRIDVDRVLAAQARRPIAKAPPANDDAPELEALGLRVVGVARPRVDPLTAEAITASAKACGVSEDSVHEMLKLQRTDPEAYEALRNGSARTVAEAMRVAGGAR
ncbi:MAG: hypothetical protein WKG00_18250 [Polyangiaceae bacterium]